ncbi:ABC transporter substrate-binding protein [Vreelandella olivaria]|uniref:ABC transporter substrate-binding protein n=1 Tax=Vreelandella olivaria TaxID=390919 RepID=UPI00201EB34C|nr:ABC transporter substrate-binding protein [Halomonas olivaria]
MQRTKRVLSGAIAGLALSVAFSTSAQAGSLTIASPQDPGSWDPIDTFLVNWAAVATNIFDGLTYRGPDMELVPGLATEWEELDDGTRIRFILREGVTFHNGEAFNAEAVKFTFDRLLGDAGAQGPQRSNYTAIDSVEVIDDYTVDFHLSEPDPVLLTKLAGYGAMIVPPEYLAEHGDEHFNTHPVGTGPFRVVAYTPRENVKLEAYADHWGGAPKLDEVTYRFISEPSTAVAELQAGRVDIVIPPTIPIGMIDTINNHAHASVVSVPSPTVEAIRFNTQSGITADERVRKALIMAVDRQAIIDSILAGEGEMIASFQGAQSFGNDPDMQPLPFDPQQARQLLDEAGIGPGATVQIDVRGNDSTFGEVAQVVASYLQGVGITVSIQPYETNVLLNDIIPAGRTGEMFQQKWGGWTFDFDNTAYLMYHTGERWNPYDSDAELDEMLQAQRSITDPDEREALLQAIARYTQDRALEMPLYSINALYGVRDRVQNFEPAPDNRMRLTDVDVTD